MNGYPCIKFNASTILDRMKSAVQAPDDSNFFRYEVMLSLTFNKDKVKIQIYALDEQDQSLDSWMIFFEGRFHQPR